MAVLGTKIRIPDAGRDQVPRRRLTDRLGDGAPSRPRLVLVSAPPGFGKTTILSQWLRGSSEGAPSVAWLSLDEGDNDLRRFLTHLVAALRTTGDVGAEAAQLLETAAEPPVEAVLTSIVNDLDQREEQTVVVLDDYHVIESPEVHRAVNFLLDHLPLHAGLAIATRADPPLPQASEVRSGSGVHYLASPSRWRWRMARSTSSVEPRAAPHDEDQRQAAAAEMARVLRPGGRVLVADFRPPSDRLGPWFVKNVVGLRMASDPIDAIPTLAGAGFTDLSSGDATPWLPRVSGTKASCWH